MKSENTSEEVYCTVAEGQQTAIDYFYGLALADSVAVR